MDSIFPPGRLQVSMLKEKQGQRSRLCWDDAEKSDWQL